VHLTWEIADQGLAVSYMDFEAGLQALKGRII
jgi:hypothetical protein